MVKLVYSSGDVIAVSLINATELPAAVDNAGSPGFSILHVFQRRKKLIFCVFATGLACTMLYFATATRYYESEAKLFVKMGRQSVTLDPTANTGQQISVRETQNQEVFTVQELLSSRKLAEAVVESFGAEVIIKGGPTSGDGKASLLPSVGDLLEPLNAMNMNPLRVYSFKDKAVKAFSKNLTVLAGKQTNVISLSYESEDPGHSRAVLEKLIELGREEHLQMHNIRGSQDFFIGQAKLLRCNLDDLEQQLSDLKSTTGIASLETHRDHHLGLLNNLRQMQITMQAELSGLSEEIKHRLNRQLTLPETIVLESTADQPQTVTQALREKLFELEVKEEEFVSIYNETHPKLVQIRKQLAETRAIANRQGNTPATKTGLNENYQAMELAILEGQGRATAMRTTLAAMEKEIERAEAKLSEINTAELAIRKLEREIELAAANYRTYSGNLEQARIDQEINFAGISSLNAVQEPTFVETPSNPKPSMALGVGVILSSLLGMLAGLVLEKMPAKNRDLRRPQETIATIPPSSSQSASIPQAEATQPDLALQEAADQAESNLQTSPS